MGIPRRTNVAVWRNRVVVVVFLSDVKVTSLNQSEQLDSCEVVFHTSDRRKGMRMFVLRPYFKQVAKSLKHRNAFRLTLLSCGGYSFRIPGIALPDPEEAHFNLSTLLTCR